MQRTQHISDDKYAIYILENMVFVYILVLALIK